MESLLKMLGIPLIKSLAKRYTHPTAAQPKPTNVSDIEQLWQNGAWTSEPWFGKNSYGEQHTDVGKAKDGFWSFSDHY